MKGFVLLAALALTTAFGPLRRASPPRGVARRASLNVADVVDRTSPSLCVVRTAGPRGMNATGTGIVIDAAMLQGADASSLWILTNAHVVPPSMKLDVVFGAAVLEAQLVGRATVADVALLRVDGAAATAPALRFASKPRLGADALALGYAAQGDDGPDLLVTRGIVSGLPFRLGVEYVATDALLRGGVSGGPLLDASGEVVGVCTYVDNGLGHAISSDRCVLEARAILAAFVAKSASGAALEHAVYLYNDRMNKKARVAQVLAQVYGATAERADMLMDTAHKKGRAECAVYDDAADAAKFAAAMIAGDLVAEVEARTKVPAA
ncbi:trypsin-like cysteine/serine peptidase domain-containing protein [Pelagophyceae sp. CCMP2097]|nr:trypsin-like cysteine/serine peptidase domain-containing protein [Pelagophyceae sp. CCMP2097]|mmetsp:Transcript_30327/g.102328  ORF Transcript_30327/g.102328 Transcript_30327/m.102328 type:complete len:323 (-) Transcript_30327:25-993(-)